MPGDQPVPGEAAGRDEQLPAEDWHPRTQDHREGDGEELHQVTVKKLQKVLKGLAQGNYFLD